MAYSFFLDLPPLVLLLLPPAWVAGPGDGGLSAVGFGTAVAPAPPAKRGQVPSDECGGPVWTLDRRTHLRYHVTTLCV